MQCVRGKAPNFDTVALLKEESGLEEIILCKVIDESHTGNVELKNLDPCENDPIIYTIGTSGTWTRSIDDVFPVLVVNVDDSGKIMLHHTSLSEIKSQLSSRSYEYRSTAVIKRGFYMGSRLDVTPLLGDDHFIKI